MRRRIAGLIARCAADICESTNQRINAEGVTMSKSMDRKKESKKKPAKTFEEKRAAKREKRTNRR